MADVEELARRLVQMEQTQAEIIQALQAQHARSDAAEAGLREAASQLEGLRAAQAAAPAAVAAHASGSTIDTRTLGKPQTFSGKRDAWKEFRFVFEAFASAVHLRMPALFRRSESMGGQIIDASDLDEETTAVSRQLYYMLVMLTTDDAHRLMSNVEQGNGAEDWRRLCWEHEPDVRVRHGAVLHALLRREFGKDAMSDLAEEIETFEREVRRWEDQSGKTLDPDIKMSVLMGGMRNTKVREHLELDASRLNSYTDARTEVLNFAVAKRTWTFEVDDPMVIGAVSRKGKGKGKNKDGKGQTATAAEASVSGKPTDRKDNPAAGKECHYCKKPNHFKSDCRKLKADIAAGKVDAKGRPLHGKGSAGARSLVPAGGAGFSPEPHPHLVPPPARGAAPVSTVAAYPAWATTYPGGMFPSPGPTGATLLTGTPPSSQHPTGGSASDAPWAIYMVVAPSVVAKLSTPGVEFALVDSGSGVVACPADYAPDVPLLPPAAGTRPMVSATNEPIVVYGQKIITYVLDNGEELAITWNVANVNCLILSTAALRRGGATAVLAPERSMLCTVRGGCVDLVSQSDVPWLRLRRQVHGVRAARSPMAIEEEDPDAAGAATSDRLEDVRSAPAASSAVAEDSAPALAARPAAAEPVRRGPAPVETSEEARDPRGVRVPDGPTCAEKEIHNLPHIPFRAWCSCCTRGAAADDPHNARSENMTPVKPVIMMDYTFVTDPPYEMLTFLVVYDIELGMVLPLVVDEKGPIECAIRSVVETLSYWGRKAIVLRVDAEPAIKALAEAVQLARSDATVMEVKPRYSPQSMGAVENMNKEVKNMLRIFTLQVRDSARVELHTSHPLVSWLVRHCGWCINMYRVHSDGRTAYERLKGRPYSGNIAMFGECLWYRSLDAFRLSSLDERWTTAIWLGKSVKSDEHVIVVGSEVRLARSVRRKAEGKRWSKCLRRSSARHGCHAWTRRRPPSAPGGTSRVRMSRSIRRPRSALDAWADPRGTATRARPASRRSSTMRTRRR